MADINSQHAGAAKTEGDGISYRGIGVFVVIRAVTTIVCELIVVGMYKMMDAKSRTTGVARAPMSAPAGTLPPPPNLLLNEPLSLQQCRAKEANELNTYGWVDKNAGTVRLPIERAKDLLLERGLPARGEAPVDALTTDAKTAGVKK
jgi:hypothetical protein